MVFPKLKKRERYIAYLAAAIIGFLLFDNFVIQPILSELKRLNKQISVKEKKLRESLKLLAQEEGIDSEYKKYAGRIKQEGSNEEEIARVLSQIEVIGRQANVSLTSLKPSEVIEKEFYKEYIIKVGIKATMIHFVDFVYKLEKTPQLIRVDDFRITPKKKGSAVIEADLSISKILIL